MIQEIKVGVSYKEITHKIITVDLPEIDRYYRKGASANEYGSELFAILLDGRPTSGHYYLVRICQNSQDTTDFIPRSDTQSSYWVDGSNGLRSTALKIMTNEASWFSEITEDEFYSDREILLNKFKTRRI
jgi:hypothetical protein